MFIKAVESAKSLDLTDGWTYRFEYLQSPKHNTLAYNRTPEKFLILFDIMRGPEDYMSPAEKQAEAKRLGIECVPVLFEGVVTGLEQFNALLDRESVLGGCKIEGVVVKNYSLFTADKKVAVGKYVSEAFKEKHQGEWKKSNPAPKDVVAMLVESLKVEARWRKALQHLKEAGEDTETPRCIGPLINEVKSDVGKEESEYIKDALFKHFWPQISRGITAGLPDWFKAQMTESAFSEKKEAVLDAVFTPLDASNS
jgi:hypothetical protein